jgi:hypothetical protein
MRASRYGAALLLLTALVGYGRAGAADPSIVQGRQSTSDRPPISSLCQVKCDELEKTCEEHERLSPTCSVVNICFEEKAQCEALCRPRVMLKSRARS